MAKTCVGLDIGSSSIKAVQLSRAGDGYTIDRAGVSPVPLGAIEGGAVHDVAAVGQILIRLMRQARIKASQVMAAVAGQAVIVRSVKYQNSIPPNEALEDVRFAAEKFIPFPVNEAVIDRAYIGEIQGTDEYEVMLVAAQRNIIESHVETLRQAKMRPQAIDVQPFALARALGAYLSPPVDGQTSNVAMIDIGSGTTDLVIFRGDVLRFTRIIPIGGNYFTRAIAGRLGMSEEEAEALKLSRGQVPLGEDQKFDSPEDAQLNSVIGAVMAELVTEIRRSLDYFRLQYHEEVGRLVATGGGIMLRNMVGALERELGITVESGDPLAPLNLRRAAPELLINAGPIFCVAIGLALRGVTE